MKKNIYLFIIINLLCICLNFNNELNVKGYYSSEEELVKMPNYDPSFEGEEYVLNLNARNIEPNVVRYNMSSGTVSYMYLNNSFNTIQQTIDSETSYTQNFVNDGNPPAINYLENDLEAINNPDKRVGYISSGGTAFLMGPNIALTAGHCVIKQDSPRNFYSNLTIKFGYDGVQSNSNFEANVVDVYILKLYYDNFSYANDWAICVLNKNLGNQLGIFGKCTGFDLLDYEASIVGYPGGQATKGQYLSKGEIVKNNPSMKYYAYTVGGFSGSPVCITHNGHTYVAGIHSYSVYDINNESGIYFGGAARITSFLFDFLNYFLDENNKGVELRDYYYDGLTKIRYNTMSELIITPRDDLNVFLSEDGNNFINISTYTSYFYTSTTTSTTISTNYNYFKNCIISTGVYSQVYSFENYFTEQARTAQYKIVNKTSTGDVLSTIFDQSDNIWYHYGLSGQTIKGTIAYEGYAKNIEVKIPSSGTNISSEVLLNGVKFQLRVGKNRVSIKSTEELICSQNIIFAFGVA